MNKAVPWSIKGVDFDARSAAKEAARRAGMTLGEWLNSVIAEQAAELGVEPADVDDEERLAAVASRLHKMSGGPKRRRNDRAPLQRRVAGGQTYVDDDYDSEDTDAFLEDQDFDEAPSRARRPAARRAGPRQDIRRYRDPDALLDEAVQRFDRMARRDSIETNAALDKVSRRLADLESQIENRDSVSRQPDRSLQRALTRLETRIEALASREDRPAMNAGEPLDARLADIAARLRAQSTPRDGAGLAHHGAPYAVHGAAAVESAADTAPIQHSHGQPSHPMQGVAPVAPASGMRSSDLVRIEAKLNMLLDRGGAPGRNAPRGDMMSEPAAARSPDPYAPRRAMSASIAEINRRQADLDGGAPALRPARPAAPAYQEHVNAEPAAVAPEQGPAQALLTSLKGEITNLAQRVEDMRREAGRQAAQAELAAQAQLAAQQANAQRESSFTDSAAVESIAGLRQQIASMGEQLSQLAPRHSLDSLQKAIGDLASQMNTLRQSGLRENIVEPVENLVSEVRRSLASFASNSSMAALGQELQSINSKIEAVAGGRIDPADFARVQQQTAEIHDLLAAAAARPMALEKIEQQIGALGKRVELIAGRGPSPQGAAAVHESVGEIRTALDQAVPVSAFSKLESQIETLSRRFDAYASKPGDPQVASISERIDALQKAMTWQNERLPAMKADSGELHDMVRAVIHRLDTVSTTTNNQSIDTSALEKAVRDLAVKIESASTLPEGSALGAIEEQVRDIAIRLESAGAAARSIAGIEHTLGELFSRLEENRLAAIDAAENAARLAVRETLEETMHTRASLHEGGDSTREQVAKEIAGLRSLQDAADRRTHSTLSAVHETLEKIVDRLAVLESETETQPVAPPAAAPIFAADAPARNSATAGLNFAPAPPMPEARPVERPADSATPMLASGPAPIFASVATPSALDVQSAAQKPAPQAVRPESAETYAPAVSLEQLEADELLEPGAGLPSRQQRSAGSIFGPSQVSPQTELRSQNDSATRSENARIESANASSSFIAAARRAQQAAQQQADEDAKRQPVKATGVGVRVSALVPGDALAEAQSRARAAATALSGSLKRKPRGKSAAESDLVDTELEALAHQIEKDDETPTAQTRRQSRNTGATGASLKRMRSLLMNRKVLLGLAGLVILAGGYNILRQKMNPPAKQSAAASARVQSPAPAAGKQQANAAAPLTVASPASSSLSPLGAEDGRNAGQFTSQNTPPAAPQLPPGAPIDREPVSSIPGESGGAGAGNNLFHAVATGDISAQYELGVRHIEGNGVTRNATLGVGLLEKAANNGLAQAQYRLGSIFEKGLGVAKDAGAARKWYTLAAEAGNVRAMHNLGVLIAEGADRKPDYQAAAKWFRAAAEHGVRDSQYNLAILYARGLGVPQNMIESHFWFALAAAQGDSDAGTKREDVAKRLSANQLAVAKARAESFKQTPAKPAANEVPSPAGGWQLDQPSATAPSAGAQTPDPVLAPVRAPKSKKRQRVSSR